MECLNREATALATLSHPHIVSIIDKGVFDGRYFFAMGYGEGTNLRDVLQTQKLSPEPPRARPPPAFQAPAPPLQSGPVRRGARRGGVTIPKGGTRA